MRKIYLYEDSGLSSEPQTLLEVAQAPHLAAANGQISEDAAVLSVASQQALASFAADNEPELMASLEAPGSFPQRHDAGPPVHGRHDGI